MKKLFFLLSITILISCENAQKAGTGNTVVDARPKKEVEFLKLFNDADSVYNERSNEITKKEALDSGKVKIADFAIDQLNGKIENWPAVVHSIQLFVNIETTFMIQKGADKDEYHSLILFSSVDTANTKIKDLLKPLSKGDSVLITGVFEKNSSGKVDFEPYVSVLNSDEAFTNPKFNFTITSIKKK